MATIVTRSGKGSALTFAEMDANFVNINNELANVSLGVLPANSVSATELDNSGDFTVNTLTTTGNISVGDSIKPSSGNLELNTDYLVVSDAAGTEKFKIRTDQSPSADQILKYNETTGFVQWANDSGTSGATQSVGDFTLNGNLDLNGNYVVDSTGATRIGSLSNANIELQANGTGELVLENGTTSGNIKLDITNGQTMSWWIEPDNFVEIQGGRYASGLRVYDSSVGTGDVAGFQLDGFHFDKHFGSPQKLGGQFSIQLFGQGLPKESYGSFDEAAALGVHQKFEIKDNSDYYQGTVDVTNGDATVGINDANLTANISAGDWIRIEGAVSDSAGYRMSGNLQCEVLSVDSGNNEIELDISGTPSNSAIDTSDLITGTGLNATIMSGSSTAINMSAGTRNAVHTFTHQSNQFGTNVSGNDRVDLQFQAKTVEFKPGLSGSEVNAIKAYSDTVYINEDNADIDFRVNSANIDNQIYVDGATGKLSLRGDHEYDGTTFEPYPGVEITSGGLLVEGTDYTGILVTKRTTTAASDYSLEVATQYSANSWAAGNPAGSFGFAAYSDNNGYVYPGTIAGIVGDNTSNIADPWAALGNNGVEIRTFDTGGKAAPYSDTTQAAEFRATHLKFMDNKLQFNYANAEVEMSTPTSGDDIKITTTGSGYIILSNLPTSSAGLPTGAVWNDSGTLKIA